MKKQTILGVVIIAVIFFTACSSTVETTKHTELTKRTEEIITIEPMTVPVPEVKGKFDVPLIRVDTTAEKELNEIYQTSQVIETENPLTGKKSKAVIDIRQERKKDKKGKSFLSTEVNFQQEDINTEGKKIYSKETTDSSAVDDSKKKTEGLLVVIWNSVKWWILIFFIIAIPIAILIKKVGWTVTKKYIGL
jgi:hypothetical protein